MKTYGFKGQGWDFPDGPVVKTPQESNAAAWVQSLVWELRSHRPHLAEKGGVGWLIISFQRQSL